MKARYEALAKEGGARAVKRARELARVRRDHGHAKTQGHENC